MSIRSEREKLVVASKQQFSGETEWTITRVPDSRFIVESRWRFGISIRRVLTDNGSCYRHWLSRKTLWQQHIKHRFTRPYTPRTNGKAERFIQTMLREWAYARS